MEIFYLYLSALSLVIPFSQLWAEAGYHHEAHEEHEENRSIVKISTSCFWHFSLFFFASFMNFVVQKKHR